MIPVAKVGERIRLEGHERGAAARVGTVVEVGGDATSTWYRVRWDDGRQSPVFPHHQPHRLLCPASLG
jgi:hypothetical protein